MESGPGVVSYRFLAWRKLDFFDLGRSLFPASGVGKTGWIGQKAWQGETEYSLYPFLREFIMGAVSKCGCVFCGELSRRDVRFQWSCSTSAGGESPSFFAFFGLCRSAVSSLEKMVWKIYGKKRFSRSKRDHFMCTDVPLCLRSDEFDVHAVYLRTVLGAEI